MLVSLGHLSLLLSFLCSVQAQFMFTPPKCLESCVTEYLGKTSCSRGDITCMCADKTQPAIRLGSCVFGSECTSDDTLAYSERWIAACPREFGYTNSAVTPTGTGTAATATNARTTSSNTSPSTATATGSTSGAGSNSHKEIWLGYLSAAIMPLALGLYF